MPSRISFLYLILFTVFSTPLFAQKDKVLFTVQDQKVYASEFSDIYEKNLSLVQDASQWDIDNYIRLFVQYKLKLLQAYQLKMDTVQRYKDEYEKYANQLIQPYLKDPDFEQDLLKEAYDRIQKEVNASHILIKNTSKTDTLDAYQKITAIRERILKGENFETVAREVSDDPSAKKNGGNLGYFTAFQMVYPFENVAFNTPVNEVSKPFTTQFGYHIVKVNDVRKSQGEVEVAHIMLRGDTSQNKALLENLKTQLAKGEDFATLALNYSQDVSSAKNGGLLPKFGAGRMIPSFEKTAFSLQNEGDVSEPFQTEFGWHLVKLVKKYPVGTFEEMKPLLKQKIDQGKRGELMDNSLLHKLLKQYDIKTDEKLLSLFAKSDWQNNHALLKNSPVLTIESEKISVKDFYNFYALNTNKSYQAVFQNFKENKVLDYFKKTISNQNPEVRKTLKEYREGLLIFDLMQQKIWNKAEKDSSGLQTFYLKNRAHYKLEKRADLVYISSDNQSFDSILKDLNLQTDLDSIWSKYKENGLVDVREERVALTSESFPQGLNPEGGAFIQMQKDHLYHLYYVKDILPEDFQKLDDIKGKVMSDYQEFLEKEWMEELAKEYPVKLNQKTVSYLKTKYKL